MGSDATWTPPGKHPWYTPFGREVPDRERAPRACLARLPRRSSEGSDQKGISAARLTETVAAIDELEPQFRDAMSDEAAFGPAKSLFLAMTSEGVDIRNEEAVQGWIGAYNARRMAESAQSASSRGSAGRRGRPHEA